MVMVMVMAAAADRLCQIRHVGELAALRGVGKIGRQRVELSGCRRIAVGGRSLRRILQVGGDLLGDLLVLGRVRLLQLLQLAHELRERRKLAAILLLRRRRAHTAAGCAVGRQTGSLKSGVENLLQITIVKVVDGASTHAGHIGTLIAVFNIIVRD